MRTSAAALLAIAAVVAGGCADAPAEPWSDAWLLDEGQRYLNDAAYRRASLLSSLENEDNVYARERIANYGLDDTGWDALPEWNPTSTMVRAGAPAALADDAEPLWDGREPQTMDEWIALGREVFFRYPLRTDAYLAFGLGDEALAADVGIQEAPDGTLPGVLAFRDVDGTTRVGLACALCHTDVRDGEMVVGSARRSFDYGRLRIAYHDATGVPIDDDLRRRMADWGPGRADITADETEDPVAIPDLWGLRHQSSLTQAGTIRHVGPAALAIRQETQLLHANYQRARPPRVLTLALSLFLYSLRPPEPVSEEPIATLERGAAIFEAECAQCHSNEVFGGPIVPHSLIGTEPSLAIGQARGTGHYRPPALLGVRWAAPYFHHGAVGSLEDLLGEERFAATYDQSPLGAGPVAGHRFGTDLPDDDRDALLAFLRSL